MILDPETPRTSEHEVAGFEAQIGAKLPSDYRGFLLAHNGGYTTMDVMYRDEHGNEMVVGEMGGFRPAGMSLPFARTIYQAQGIQRIPDDLIWIADDPAGNAFCLGIKGEQVGRVYFWDHENEPEAGGRDCYGEDGNLELLANTFTAFVNALGVDGAEAD